MLLIPRPIGNEKWLLVVPMYCWGSRIEDQFSLWQTNDRIDCKWTPDRMLMSRDFVQIFLADAGQGQIVGSLKSGTQNLNRKVPRWVDIAGTLPGRVECSLWTCAHTYIYNINHNNSIKKSIREITRSAKVGQKREIKKENEQRRWDFCTVEQFVGRKHESLKTSRL